MVLSNQRRNKQKYNYYPYEFINSYLLLFQIVQFKIESKDCSLKLNISNEIFAPENLYFNNQNSMKTKKNHFQVKLVDSH